MVFEHEGALPESNEEVNNQQGFEQRLLQNRLIGKDHFRSDAPHPNAPKRIGYIRVSTKAQIVDRQVLQLEAECDELHLEQVSAVAVKRPVFDRVIRELQPGHTLVVADLDRAFRSSIDAMLTADLLRQRNVSFRILSLNVDTRTPEGELFYSLIASFAQYERRIISRRTKEGLEAAKRRGVRLGRPTQLRPEAIKEAYEWMAEAELPCRYVAALLGVSRLTLQRGFHRLALPYPLRP